MSEHDLATLVERVGQLGPKTFRFLARDAGEALKLSTNQPELAEEFLPLGRWHVSEEHATAVVPHYDLEWVYYTLRVLDRDSLSFLLEKPTGDPISVAQFASVSEVPDEDYKHVLHILFADKSIDLRIPFIFHTFVTLFDVLRIPIWFETVAPPEVARLYIPESSWQWQGGRVVGSFSLPTKRVDWEEVVNLAIAMDKFLDDFASVSSQLEPTRGFICRLDKPVRGVTTFWHNLKIYVGGRWHFANATLRKAV